MAAEGKITLNSKQYEATLAAVKSKTARAGADMSASMKGFGREVGGAGKAVAALSSEVGSQFGTIGRVISSLASGPVAMLAAAFGVLLAIGAKVLDELTVSAEEHAKKLEYTSRMQEKQLDALKKQQAAEDGYMERIKELSEKESLSNEEKDEMVFLVNTLSEKYGELGIELDGVTGKINNLAQAEQNLNEKQKQSRISALESLIKTETQKSASAYKAYYEGGAFGLLRMGSDRISGNKSGADIYAERSLENRMWYAQTRMAKPKNEKDFEFWSQEIDRLEKINELTEELNHLRETGTSSTSEQAAVMKQASQASVEATKKQTEAQKDLYEAEQKAVEEFQKEIAAARELERANRNRKEQYVVGQVAGMRDAALRATGQGKQADIEAAIWSATQAKGSALSGDEYDKTVEMATLKHELSQAMQNRPGGVDFAPRVNSLVARGGSEAPVKMPGVESLQAKSLAQQEKIARITDQIFNRMEDWLTI